MIWPDTPPWPPSAVTDYEKLSPSLPALKMAQNVGVRLYGEVKAGGVGKRPGTGKSEVKGCQKVHATDPSRKKVAVEG